MVIHILVFRKCCVGGLRGGFEGWSDSVFFGGGFENGGNDGGV